VVLIDRLLNDLSEDISRQSNYVSNERRNLTVLSLAIKNGELYGGSLNNRAFASAAPQQIGGFSGRTMSEDTDATIGLRCAGWRIAVQPDAGAVTEAPGDWGRLLRQRKRWIWGNVQVAVRQLLDTIGADRVGWPAIQFATMTAWHLGAYLLASWGVVAIALGQYSPTAQVTTAFLLLLSALRLYIALVVQGDSARSLPRAMLSSFVMQVVNVLAFWTGLATGSAWRHRWT